MKQKLKKIILNICSKRTLYILCFIVLNIFDVLRNSQNGDIWKTVANCTGLILLLIVASAYEIKKLFTPFSFIWTGLCMIAMAVFLFRGEPFIKGVYIWTLETALLNVWWIGIFAVHLFKRIFVEKKRHFRPGLLGWLWIAMTVLMTASVSGRLWPIWFLMMFGIFYLTEYSQEDRDALMDGMIDGTIIAFFCIQIYAYGFRPYDRVRYVGAYSNSNMAALHYLIIYIMILFKLHLLEMRGGKRGWKLFFFIGAGGLLAFQFMTMGRTAWLASIVITLLYGILVMRKLWQCKWRNVLIRGAALILCMLLTFPAVFATVRWLPTILHHPVWYAGEYSIDKVHSFDPANSWKYVEIDEFLKEVSGRILGSFGIVRLQNPFVLQVYAADEDTIKVVEKVGVEKMDDALKGRISIYKAYFNDLTWYGHPASDGRYLLEGTRYISWHAQNVWLQIAYYYGIPAGILFVVITLWIVYYYYKKMIKAGSSFYAAIPFLFCILFFIFGMLEVVWNIGQLVLFLFFFVQHPQIAEVKE